jgi:hypothetical protein
MAVRTRPHRLAINPRDPARAQIAADIVSQGGSPVAESSLTYAFRSLDYRDRVLAVLRGSYGTECARPVDENCPERTNSSAG